VDREVVGEDRAVVGTTVADLMKFFASSTFAYMNDGPQVLCFHASHLIARGFIL